VAVRYGLEAGGYLV